MIESLRSQLEVLTLLVESDFPQEFKLLLSGRGYKPKVYYSEFELKKQLSLQPAHLIVINPDALSSQLSDFVESVLNQYPATRFIFVGAISQAKDFFEYQDFNLHDFVSLGDSLHDRLIWSIDRYCFELAKISKIKSLNTEIEDYKSELKDLSNENSKMRQQSENLLVKLSSLEEKANGRLGHSLGVLLEPFQSAKEKEDLVLAFFSAWSFRLKNQTNSAKGVFFRYLPSVQSFIATMAHGFDLDAVKGVGGRLTTEQALQLDAQLKSRQVPTCLHELVYKGLKAKDPLVLSLNVNGELEGVFVLWADVNFKQETLDHEWAAFEIIYSNFVLTRKLSQVVHIDPVTELGNQEKLQMCLQVELARSSRDRKPVSLVALKIDQADKLTELGKTQKDLLVKSVSQLLVSTSRIQDIVCRIGTDQFAIVLVNCSAKQAGLKVQKLNELFSKHRFYNGELQISFSSGVSEYPSLVRSADELLASSLTALDFASQKGQQRIVMYKPEQKFQPDFEITK